MKKSFSFSLKKLLIIVAVLLALGALLLWATQMVFKSTNTTEFCVSCHSMTFPKEEYEGSVHFSNKRGIRAECADCHLPPDTFHYLKAKILAVKDVYGEIIGKIPDQDAYEEHRLEMAQSVWKNMKELDSSVCRSCHNEDAWIIEEQRANAQTMHKLAQETNQTCIDCHKGLVHFMPDIPVDTSNNNLSNISGDFKDGDDIYATSMLPTKAVKGGEVRVLPFVKLYDWKDNGDKTVTATIHGYQQEGAENVLYQEQGKRIMSALLDDDAKANVKVLSTVFDNVTNSNWHKVEIEINADKSIATQNLDELNKYGNNLNQSYCSTCHAVISASHYTANQWIGVINSMKDRTSITDGDVRFLTIYLQLGAKDMGNRH